MKDCLTFAEGFLGAEYCASKCGMEIDKMKYFDWERAKKIILEHPNSYIEAGLREDWCNTYTAILYKGKICEPWGFYGASYWATPVIEVDGVEIECWTYDETKEKEKVADWVYELIDVPNWQEKL